METYQDAALATSPTYNGSDSDIVFCKQQQRMGRKCLWIIIRRKVPNRYYQSFISIILLLSLVQLTTEHHPASIPPWPLSLFVVLLNNLLHYLLQFRSSSPSSPYPSTYALPSGRVIIILSLISLLVHLPLIFSFGNDIPISLIIILLE